MNLEARILFKDVVADTDLEDVAYTLQCCVNEWFYPEITKTMPEVRISIAPPEAPTRFEPFAEPFANHPPNIPALTPLYTFDSSLASRRKVQPKKPAPDVKSQPIYVVSDLHLGDIGPRDNFAHMSGGRTRGLIEYHRLFEFQTFLDFVEKQNGRLIIVGDFFELWQSNISQVLTARIGLLDRLAKMGAIYILGNHDADLCYFCQFAESPFSWLAHPFFKTMATCHTEYIGNKSFHFIHGHEVDRYCAGDIPGLGRIIAIYTGLKEDRNGSPFLNKFQTIEAKSVGRLERMANFVRWCCRKPNRMKAMNLGLCEYLCGDRGQFDALVSGHTHIAGQLYSKEKGGLPIYNTGTWAESVCSYVVINPTGNAGVFDWINNQSVPNSTLIRV